MLLSQFTPLGPIWVSRTMLQSQVIEGTSVQQLLLVPVLSENLNDL